MTQVTDDLHRMVLLQSSNIRDLQNMMTGLLIIISVLIFLVLALLTIIGILVTIPMQTTPRSMPYYSGPTAATYDAPPLTTSVADAATPSVSSLIDSENPEARVFVGNLNACVSREDLVELFKSYGNVLGATLFKGYAFIQFSKQSEAELCVQILNGYTWKGSQLDVKILTLNSTNDAVDHSNDTQNISGSSFKYSGGVFNMCHAGHDIRQSIKQNNFNQRTTNFIVCCLDPLKPCDV